jgi:tetratricopeptide (TPR) repeat protein
MGVKIVDAGWVSGRQAAWHHLQVVDPAKTSESGEPAPPETSAREAGVRVGRYVVIAPLDAGGRGVAYSAYDPELGRKVALELLRADPAGDQLLREAQALAKLAHPNVVAIFDVGAFRDRVFLAMELVEGQPLSQWLTSEVRSWPAIVEIFLAAGAGLAAAHRSGLPHGDFQPENVMLGVDGQVRVRGFELAEGRPSDAGGDQDAFCVALHHALYGAPPESCGEDPERAGKGRVPRFLRRVLERGLSQDSAARFASLDELLAALRSGRRRRRWTQRGLAAAGIAAVLATGLWSRESRLERNCRTAGDPAARAWSPEVRAATGATFAATGLPFAERSWATVGPQVDAWAAAWREQSELSCRATFVQRVQSEKLFELRRACLEQRLRGFEALLGLWRQADAKAIGAARDAIAGLSDLASCADGRTLLDLVEPPAGSRPEVATLRGALAEVSSLRLATDFRQARERLAPVQAQVGALDHPPLTAEAEFLAGELHESFGEYAEAHKAYFRAYVAARRGRHEEIAFRASRELGWIDGFRLQKLDAGDEWVALANARLDSLGNPPALRRQLLDLRASLLYVRSEHAAAEALYREVLAAIEREPDGATNPARVEALSRIALVVLDQERFDSAIDYHQQTIEAHRAIFGEGHPGSARHVMNLGTVYYTMGRYHEAIPHYEKALALFRVNLGESHPDVAYLLNNLGASYEELGDARRSLGYYERALETMLAALGPHHLDVILARYNVAGIYRELGELPRARELIAEALRSAESVGEVAFRVRAYSLSGLAQIEIAARRPGPAMAAIDQALALLGARIHPREEAVGRRFRAQALWLAGRRAEARADARRSIALFRQLGRSEADAVAAWLAARE